MMAHGGKSAYAARLASAVVARKVGLNSLSDAFVSRAVMREAMRKLRATFANSN